MLAQLILGLKSWNLKKELRSKYAYTLSSQIDVSKLLEDYLLKHKGVILKASDQLDNVSYSESNIIYINKEVISSKDLYSNIYILFTLELAQKKYNFIREVPIYQNILFVLQFVFFFIAFIFPSDYSDKFIIIGVINELFTIFLTLITLMSYHTVLDKILIQAKQLLILDPVEEARAEALVNELKYKIFEYPFELTWRVYQFLKP